MIGFVFQGAFQQQISPGSSSRLSPAKRLATQQQQQNSGHQQHANQLASNPAKHESCQQQQQPQQQLGTPLSYRKRPRKPPRPRCSGPSGYCLAPSPETNTQRVISKSSTHVRSPDTARQLRPRQHQAGRWAAGGRRQNSSRQGSPGASDGHSDLQRKAAVGNPSNHKGDPPPESTAGCRQAVISPAGESGADAQALPDQLLMVGGQLTEWTETADKSILCMCMIRAQGQPTLETFKSLAHELSQQGRVVSVGHVRARFDWLLQKFSAAQAGSA